MPLRHALRTALGIPGGIARSLYPVNLIHYDTAIRPIASENRAAHVRYWQRIRSMPESRLQRCALDMQSPQHPWLKRTLKWRDRLVAADPDAAIAEVLSAEPALAPPSDARTPMGRAHNHAINVAVAQSDTTTYLEASRLKGRPVMTLAMRDAPCTQRQPYCRYHRALPLMLFRAGRFERDPTAPSSSDDALHISCPDCACTVTAEDDDILESVRAFRMMLHRVTSCASKAAVTNWYHDVAVRVVPSEAMARAVVGARAAEVLWAAGQDAAWEQSCLPFLRHLLSPTTMCPVDDLVSHRQMINATRLFLTTLDVDIALLPDAASFGGVPALQFVVVATPGIPAPIVIDDSYWKMVERHMPPVPRAPPGHEAEAPWVRPRRRIARRRGHGVMPD
jgi:hypothetical protein